MNPREKGFLLLSSDLGDPCRKCLTTAQMRTLADRSWQLDAADEDRPLLVSDLMALGYGLQMAQRIVDLLEQEDVLQHYIQQAKKSDCYPITRVSAEYPLHLRKRLGLDSPGVLWAKGHMEILNTPMVSLVGSRDLSESNRQFAREVGRQAAKQGYTLVSGNARGADQAAQNACLAAGGKVISVVADSLAEHHTKENVLYLSLDSFDSEFSAQRALSRNRVIHALGNCCFVAQCTLGMGGTWDGTLKNLRFGWSSVFCFDDGSDAMQQLLQMGATGITMEQLDDFQTLKADCASFFE